LPHECIENLALLWCLPPDRAFIISALGTLTLNERSRSRQVSPQSTLIIGHAKLSCQA